MYGKDWPQEPWRNCQRPLAEDDGFLAPAPDCGRSSDAPLSLERTQEAKGRQLGGTVEAARTMDTDRLGRFTAQDLSLALLADGVSGAGLAAAAVALLVTSAAIARMMVAT